MTKLGIICALTNEASTLSRRRLQTQTPTKISPDITVIVSGMGVKNATAMSALLIEQHVDCLISFGTAGALSTQLKSGDIIIADSVTNQQGDVIHLDNLYRSKLLHALQKKMAPVHSARLLSMNSILSHSEIKQKMHKQFDCVAVDMESASIMLTATNANIPCLVARTIIDPVDMTIPKQIIRRTGEFGQIAITSVIMELLKQPLLIVDLIRLARHFKRAQKSMQLIAQHISKLN